MRAAQVELGHAFVFHGCLHQLTERNLMETYQFRSTVRVGIHHFKPEFQFLSEIEDYVEVVLPNGVQVVLDDLCAVDFAPFSLRCEPLHLKNYLAI